VFLPLGVPPFPSVVFGMQTPGVELLGTETWLKIKEDIKRKIKGVSLLIGILDLTHC
jgi:hypothetical protein